MIDISLFLLVD